AQRREPSEARSPKPPEPRAQSPEPKAQSQSPEPTRSVPEAVDSDHGRKAVASTEVERGMGGGAAAGAVSRAARAWHRAAGIEPAERREARGAVPLRRVRPAAVQLRGEVRERLRLAKLLAPARERRRDQRRPQPLHDA